MFNKVEKPWGHYKTLINLYFLKIKILSINPLSQLSLQKHNFRNEIWISNNIFFNVKDFDSADFEIILSFYPYFVKKQKKHRICNPSSFALKILEIQYGSKCLEEDIERFKDDWNRK